jgi:epoxyqueuosine reductase
MRTSISEEAGAGARQSCDAGWLKARLLKEGFDAAGVAAPGATASAGERLRAFLEAGFHGEMGWLAANAERRADPRALWGDVRSIAIAAMNYAPDADPRAATMRSSSGAISVYAHGADYHDILKGKLKAVAGEFARLTGEDVKVFVDTAPVMEKPLAEAAGIGWQGKHTNLVSRDFGSWLFLGAIFTTASLAPDTPERDRCGACRRCLDACPTRAFPAPYRLDARRCISYLTIEHKGQIPHEFRTSIGNRVYGCDDCLAVCPWNKFAKAAAEMRFKPSHAADNPPLAELLALDDAGFRLAFKGSPVKRIGRDRFVRNALVAAGNSGNAELLNGISPLLKDGSPLVRGMAIWAVRRLASEREQAEFKTIFAQAETDPAVRFEWECEQ